MKLTVSPSASVALKVPISTPAMFSPIADELNDTFVGVSLLPAMLTVSVLEAESGAVESLSVTFTVNCSERLWPVVSTFTADSVSFNAYV